MSVQSSIDKVIYNGDNVSTLFSFNYNIYLSTDLAVYTVVVSTGVVTPLTLNANYSIALTAIAGTTGAYTAMVNLSGGSSPYGVLPTGTQLVLTRSLPLTQLINISDYSATPAATWEQAIDRAVILIQQLQEQINRALLAPINSNSPQQFPSPQQGYVIGWGPTGLVNIIPNTNTYITTSTDGTLSSNSDALIPTQKAVKTYVDTNLVVNVKYYGAIGNGTVDDTAAIQAAINAASAAGGGTVFFPTGVYNTTATINLAAKVTLQGVNNHASIISLSTNTVGMNVLYGSVASWVVIRDLGIGIVGTPQASQNGIHLFRNGINFGVKFILEHLYIFNTNNGITIDGDATNCAMRDIYIQGSAYDGIYQTTLGPFSTCTFEDIYVSSAGHYGFEFLHGAGNCVFNNIALEGTTGTAMWMNSMSRCVFNGIYLGDTFATGGGDGLYLQASSTNVFNGTFLNGGTSTGSAIHLDGSWGNEFITVNMEGGFVYPVNVTNAIGTSVWYLQNLPNVFRSVHTTTYGSSGVFANDYTYLTLDGIGTDENSNSTTASFSRHSTMSDSDAFSSATAANASSSSYIPADPTERWGYMRQFPGVDNYSFLQKSTGSIATLPSTETLASSVLTGDSSTFATTVGSWVATNAALTSVSGGQSGNCMLITANNVNANAHLQLSGLVAGKLYKVIFYTKNPAGLKLSYLRIFNANQSTTIQQYGTYGTNTEWTQSVAYFVAQTTADWLYFFILNSVNNDTMYVDTVTVQEVQQKGSLRLSGGRNFSTTSGAGVELKGIDHTTNPGKAEITGAVTNTGDTCLLITGKNTGGVALLAVTLGATDTGGVGYRALVVPN